MIDWIIISGINKKRWELNRAVLSHPPMSKEAGRDTNSRLKEIERKFERLERRILAKKRKSEDTIKSSWSIQYDPGDEKIVKAKEDV